MFQFNYIKKVSLLCIALFTIIFGIIFFSHSKVYAAKVGYYSYNSIYKNLPKAYQSSEYIYMSDDVPCISFAFYDGMNYATSVKKTTGMQDYLYCVDYSKHISFDSKYSSKNNMFNNTLRARLGIAFYYGAAKWKGKADSRFSTGNTILDYYMTQVVVHSLIYKYGKGKSNYGIDFDKIVFKTDTGNLQKKTKAFYNFCCNAFVYTSSADFFTSEFSFEKLSQPYFYLEKDGLITPYINCITNKNNFGVKEYKRIPTVKGIASDEIIVVEDDKAYNSSFRLKIPLSKVDQMLPGLYSAKISEQVTFNRYFAGFWRSADTEHLYQETGGLLVEDKQAQDSIEISLLIGEVVVHKKDSITGELISDAVFQLQQYDDKIGEYVHYKDLTYNSSEQQYESGNIYLGANNRNGKFKLIEAKAGNNYINDWDGETFQITDKKYSFEFNIENKPVLGKLKIHKSGSNIMFSENNFIEDKNISLAGVKFGLYAKEDIFLKGKLFYPKDKKIADLVTDKNGEAYVDSLISGKYYFKEESAPQLYDLNPQIYSFTITRDENRKYNEVFYQIDNSLKKCQIRLFKFYYDKRDKKQQHKMPLQGARFGLYVKEDIMSPNGECILKKDTLIREAVSDEQGYAIFEDLPYGDYYMKELEAPKDFVLNEEIVTISKDNFKYSDMVKCYICMKEVINQKKLFKIRILKHGEVFSGYKKEICGNGEYITYQTDKRALNDIEFSLFTENDEFIGTSITDENGFAEYPDLEAGKYYVIEKSCPGEYQINKNKYFLLCESEDKNYNLLKQPVFETAVYNQLCNCFITLHKSGEAVRIEDNSIVYDSIPLKNVIFGIYQKFDYVFSSGQTLSKDTCVGYISTDKEGYGSFSAKLPKGAYYLKELQTNPGYDLDTNIYEFEVSPDSNSDIEIQFDNHNEFVNRLSKASVQIIKTDANTNKPLKNVEFTLYGDKGDKIGVYKTNKNGKIVVEQLPYGEYYFIETKCKNGYYSSNNKYNFVLESPEKITLNITNAPILKLGFEEHYKIGLLSCFILIICFIGFLMGGYNKGIFSFIKKDSHDDIS